MREYTTPPLVRPKAHGGMADLVFDNATEAPSAHVLSRKVNDGSWRHVTAREFRDLVVAVAKGLIATGINPGDRVGLMSNNRFEWTLLDFAIWTVGGQSVPVYTTSSAEQVQWILSDSGAVACVVETSGHEQTVNSVLDRTHVRNVWRLDAGAVDQLIAIGQQVDSGEVERRRRGVTPDSIATIIYTSGTTGRPKGCVLTHQNFHLECGNGVELLHPLFKSAHPDREASTLLILPLAHVFGRMVQVGAMMARARLGHASDPKKLLEDLGNFRPTFLLAVPYMLEKVYNGARQKAYDGGKGKIFDTATDTAIAYSEALDSGEPGLRLKLKHKVFDRLVYKKLREAMGGQCDYAMSGGAALGHRLSHFYRGIGLTILEGYGLTETTAAATANPATGYKLNTVGRPLPGTTVRIADDGEVLIWGGQVTQGYWNNSAATADSLENGWFHTGDLGALDEDGFLTIKGRKKEILVTSGGKNVAPAVIEDRIRAHQLISQCLVVGDGKPFVSALITIDPEFFERWKQEHGIPAGTTVEQLRNDPKLIATVQEAVDEGNKAVSRAESVRTFRILPTDFTPENGYLTPSLKTKRPVITKDFAAEINEMYTK